MKWKILGAVLAVTLVLPNVTRADFNVTATYKGVSPAGSNQVTVTLYESDTSTHAVKSISTGSGGVFNWTSVNNPTTYFFLGKSASGVTKDFISFCLEVNQTVQNASSSDPFVAKDLSGANVQAPNDGSTNRVLPMGDAAALSLRKLWGYTVPGLLADIENNAVDTLDVAAIQLAIWELASEGKTDGTSGGFDLLAGRLRVTTPSLATVPTEEPTDVGEKIVYWAKKFYDDSQTLYNGPNAPALPQLVALTNADNQDQLVQAVPEPTSLLAWGLLGFIGLVTSRRYRRRG